MFVDCTGQGSVDIDRFPFPNMIQRGVAVEASAPLRDPQSIDDFDEELRNNVLDGSPARLKLGGIAIDGYFRVIGADGQSNPRIFDIAFPHATGIRPYSYGLQACDTTAAIVVQALGEGLSTAQASQAVPEPETVTRVYDGLPTSA